jgi:S-adenosyl methyltransferase
MMEVLPLLPDDGTERKSMAQSSAAGIYDVFLGGNNNSATDRDAAVEIQNAMPDIFSLVKENRSFLRRCIGYMLGQGIKQFIDIGSGFLTSEDIHVLVHSVNPMAKVVYVDRNPAVVEQGNKLLATNGSTTIICADIRQPQDILENPDLIRFIDFSQPVGISMMCVTCFFTDSEITHIMSVIRSTICDGSYIAVTHETLDGHEDETEKIAKVQKIYENTSMPMIFRNHNEVSQILQGLQLVEPGLVFLNEWRIELDLPALATVKWLYGGLAKKDSSPLTLGPPYVSLMQLRKNLHTTAFTSTSLVVIIYWIIALVQSFMDGGAISLQQLKDMILD